MTPFNQWWEHHPLHATGALANGLAQTLLRPLAQRHPLALAAGAAAVGAMLALSRPWRWAFKPTLLNAMGPALLSSLLASGAVQSWIAEVLAKAAPGSPPPQ
ncbi:hypothetical protein [Rhodoferax sp.]|uniref:hypothetical protein n=1 Tax=Rhodoferax sp. TaxID=50421 RepID=UPI002ACE41CF|nr:hypothetical protein [Rhodoferax sp.]MDZ7919173.1 hypothetical protein [Rhodoferax sp.]